MAPYRYLLVRIMPANYQNGNTLKAFTMNVTREKQLAVSNDLDWLMKYAEKLKILAPLHIEDWETGEIVFKIDPYDFRFRSNTK